MDPDETPEAAFEAFASMFGDLSRAFGAPNADPWSNAASLAAQVATEGESEANVDPAERLRVEAIGRVAQLHIAQLTGLSVVDRITIRPVNRSQWARVTVDAHRRYLQLLADAFRRPVGDELAQLGNDPDLANELGPQAAALFAQLMPMLGPMMVTFTAASTVGQLAALSFGQYDLPLPRPGGDEIVVIAPNIDHFAAEWDLPPDDLRLWIALRDIATHALLRQPAVHERLDSLLTRYLTGFEADLDLISGRLGDFDPGSPDFFERLSEMSQNPGLVLSAMRSTNQEAVLPELGAAVAAIVGVVDHLVDRVGSTLIGSHTRTSEALRRHRVETGEASRFVERLFGLELTQATFDRGSAFVGGVVQRAGDDALARLWGADGLPTPAEITAPGLWLARLGVEAEELPLGEIPEFPDFPDLD